MKNLLSDVKDGFKKVLDTVLPQNCYVGFLHYEEDNGDRRYPAKDTTPIIIAANRAEAIDEAELWIASHHGKAATPSMEIKTTGVGAIELIAPAVARRDQFLKIELIWMSRKDLYFHFRLMESPTNNPA